MKNLKNKLIVILFVLLIVFGLSKVDWEFVRNVPTIGKNKISFLQPKTEHKKFFKNISNEIEQIEIENEFPEFVDTPIDDSLDAIINREAIKNNIKPIIIKAIIEQESQYNPEQVRYESKWQSQYGKKVKRKQGESFETWQMNFKSYGLMQIGYVLHKDLCGLNSYVELYNPEKNVACGVKIIAECLKKNDKSYCIKAYNGSGPKAEKYKKEVFARIAKLMIVERKMNS